MLNKLSFFFQKLFRKKRTKKILTIATILGIFALFTFKGFITLDPDFGWHFRMGQIILSSGIPKNDPLSYTMPSYPFIDHEWLSNILIYILYNHIGYIGLSLIFAFICTITLLIVTSGFDFKWKVPLLLWGTVILLQFAGVRTQVEDWLFIAILLRLLFDYKLWQKWRNFLPFIFLLWANLHGGFIIGIGILGFVMLIKFAEQRKIDKENLAILLFSILTTFINPYGIRLYHEIFQQLTDTTLHQTIDEWEPIWVRFSLQVRLAASVFIIGTLTTIALSRKKFSLTQISLFTIFFITAISIKRDIPIFVVVALPMLSKGFPSRPNFLSILFITTLAIFVFQTYFIILFSYNSMEDFDYPKQLVANLKTVKIKGNIFSDYGWGGYLDWKIPQYKVFIDGRMPSWRWDSAPKNQSNYAFGEYRQVVDEGNFQKIFAKYNIQTVIWPTGLFQNGRTTENGVAWLSSQINTNVPLLSALQKNHWKLIYADYISLVYEKP